jgi:hypothetical protein
LWIAICRCGGQAGGLVSFVYDERANNIPMGNAFDEIGWIACYESHH